LRHCRLEKNVVLAPGIRQGCRVAEDLEIEAPEVEPATTGDVALAAALDEARGNAELTPKVAAFFEAQTELARDQRRHMAEQFHVVRLEKWSKRLKVVLQGMAVAAGAAVLGVVCWMAWDAYQDRGLVISPFRTPPGFADRGEGGEVLAAQLQDKLLQMQRDTAAPDQGARVKAAEEQEFKLELPETGISLLELQKLMRGWLGHETTVTGSVSQAVGGSNPDALRLNVRVGENPIELPLQTDGDLSALLQTASERIYETISPMRYATWLGQHGRAEESFAVARQVARTGSDREKAEADGYLAENQPLSLADQKALLQLAVGFDPDFGVSWINLSNSETNIQKEIVYLRRGLAAMPNADLKQYEAQRLTSTRSLATRTGDFALLSKALCGAYRISPCDLKVVADRAITTSAEGADSDWLAIQRRTGQAESLALIHDVRDARRIIDAPRPDSTQLPQRRQATIAQRWLIADMAAQFVSENWSALVADSAQAREISVLAGAAVFRSEYLRYEVEGLARLGRFAEAEALLAAAEQDDPDVAMSRGVIAELKGDHAGADRWFALAERLGPDLARNDAWWARALLIRSDADGAVAKARAANKTSPHYSDALEAWGEALMAKGDFAGADSKFAEAAKYAPYWGRPHLKWAEALAKAGKADEARAQKQKAAGLDLTAAERAELQAVKA
jgi:hypothetical protein